MAVNVRVPGLVTSNITSFSVQEDATPIDPSSSAGGVGQITVGLDEFDDAEMLIGQVILTDGTRGKTSGNIRALNTNDGKLSLVADSVLGKFNTDRTAQAIVGTLSDAIQYYCDLVDIENDVVVDTTLASRPVTYPGFQGNVWVAVKQMLAKEQIEMALVFDRVYVRPLRKLTVNQERKSSDGWSIDNNNAARSVEVNYYNHSYGTQREVYPQGLNTDASVYTVGPNETIVVTIQVNASMITVNQPVPETFVYNQSYAGTDGVYSVAGNDGLPITAAQWVAQGGSVTARITDDPSVIEVTIVGANANLPAPFRLAMSSGSSTFYNSLHITGTAVVWDKKSVTLRTGVPDLSTSTEVGVTVDNKYIDTYEDALALGMLTAGAYAGLNYTVSGTAFNINRGDEGRELIQATIADFNLAYMPGTLISAFNSVWVGETIADFDAYWADQVDVLFENQLFGNATGARVLNKDANFRVTTATTSETAVQYTAALDTLVGDFNDRWPETGTVTVNTQLVTNPNSATTTVLNSGYGTGGAGSTALVPGAGEEFSYAGVQTWTTAASSGSATLIFASSAGATEVPVVPGTTLEFSIAVKTSQARSAAQGVSAFIEFYTSAGAFVGSTTIGTPVASSAGVSQRVSVSGVLVPATAARARIAGRVANLAGTTNGFTLTVSRPYVSTTPGTYFDGSTPDTHTAGVTTDYTWTGTANASTSTKTVTTGDFLISDFNDQFLGRTIKDYNVIPLRRTA